MTLHLGDKSYDVSDKAKIRVHELEMFDFFEHLKTIYRVTGIGSGKIRYMRLCDYTHQYEFGERSQQFVYKVLVS